MSNTNGTISQTSTDSNALSDEEKRDDAIQSLDKYDKFDSGNSKLVDKVGEIGDLMDEGADEKIENQRAKQDVTEINPDQPEQHVKREVHQ